MRRWLHVGVLAAATVAAVLIALFVTQDAPLVLLFAAAGAPLTVLAAVRATMTGGERTPTLWPSLLLGATLVPLLVLILHAVFVTIGFALVQPLESPARELLDGLRADRRLVDLLMTGWAYLLIIELAIVAPLAEETLKPIAALVQRPATARDAFLLGAAAGTGFAIVENLLYAGGWQLVFDESGLPVVVMRMLGSGLHALGAALTTWAVFEWRRQREHRVRRLAGAALVAFTAHGLWNGSIAITLVLYEGRQRFGYAISGDAFAWGTAMMVFLGALGTILLGVLIWAGRRVSAGETPLAVSAAIDLYDPATVGGWAIISSTLLVPATIMALVFPAIVAL